MTSSTDQRLAEFATADEIIVALRECPWNVLPEAAMRAAQSRREEITPRLVELVKKSLNLLQRGEEPEVEAFTIALYLLAEFGGSELLSIVLEMLRLEGNTTDDYFGDWVTMDASRMLCRRRRRFRSPRPSDP